MILKTVALHELGHAHRLGHVIDANAVMHYNIDFGQVRYTLDQNDIDGALYAMGEFTQTPPCAVTPMTPQHNCCDPITISTHPTNQSVSVNGTVQFSVAATDYTTIQWYSNDGSGWNSNFTGLTVSGDTTTTLTISNVPLSANNLQIRPYLQNECGDNVITVYSSSKCYRIYGNSRR